MATIDSLANETLSDIMEMLKEPSLTVWQNGEGLPTGRYDALRAAALVCSRLILESAHDSFAGHLNLLTLCTSIEHLDMRFDFDNNDSSGSISPLHLGAILDALPPNPTLRRLSISLESSTGLEGIISLLSHTSISLLDTLSFPDLAPVVKHSEGPGTEAAELRGGHEARILAAREACEERGIRMTLKGE
ncbi:hypothetical protein RQP46_003166 [Phenoliferia psychrophenolica]